MMPFTIGVFMGGWYAEFFGWRSLLYSNVVIALTVTAITGSLLYGRGFRRRIWRFDGVGFLLLAIVLFGIQRRPGATQPPKPQKTTWSLANFPPLARVP
jgi:MFS transporter, DHA2 family, multidrug resistance protein